MRAALLFWQEEICPHGDELAWLYLESSGDEPLSGEEISSLRQALASELVRYALLSNDKTGLTDVVLHSSETVAALGVDKRFVATVLVPSN
ncbi:MAG: hypothetical protein AAF974_12690 [Cyanobacteria bacterium P01_E01_bin.34]